MVVDAILSLLSSIFGLIGDLLPDVGALPFASYLEDAGDVFRHIGESCGPLNGFLPLTELFTVVGWLVTFYLPLVLLYLGVRWLYAHLPWLGKG